MTVMDLRASWVDVCRYDELMPDRGARGTQDKQVFDLRTGRCLDDPSESVPAFRARRDGERVEVTLT